MKEPPPSIVGSKSWSFDLKLGGSGHRPTKDHWFMAIAEVVALRATCSRRQVGCVLANHAGQIMSTGYNGVATGQSHCFSQPCDGARLPSGTGLDVCEAIHAEQNALLQCQDVSKISTCYVTVSPCVTCTKLLLNTGCRRIVFAGLYPSTGRVLWEKAGRLWEMLALTDLLAIRKSST